MTPAPTPILEEEAEDIVRDTIPVLRELISVAPVGVNLREASSLYRRLCRFVGEPRATLGAKPA